MGSISTLLGLFVSSAENLQFGIFDALDDLFNVELGSSTDIG